MEYRGRRILAAVQDIFFAAKITAAAKRVGVNVEFIREEDKLLQTAESSPSLVILDLNNSGINSLELVRKLKTNSPERDVQIIAYLSHVQQELMRQAQNAGCDFVVARSVFSQNLDDLLRQHSCLPSD